jgi:hypothetical protein
VIRICYSSELQPGLHGHAERHGCVTFVYLLPGLTPQQRGAALRRMRQQGRMGICPRLPVAQLAAALLADRVRTVFGQAGAIVRVHPAGSTLPVMAVSVAITSFLVLSALSVHIVHLPPQAAGGNGNGEIGRVSGGETVQPLPTPSTDQSAAPSGGRQAVARSTARPGLVPTSGSEPPSGIAPTPGGVPPTSPIIGPGGRSPGPGSGQSTPPNPVGTPSPGGSSLTTVAQTSPPPRDPAPVATVTSTPTAAPTPKPTPTSSSSGVCVDIGSLGICVGL